MIRVALMGLLLSAMTLAVDAQPETHELKLLLNEFLAGATRNDPAVHERFWAEDLVYTSSSGRRMGKAEILKDVRAASSTKSRGPLITYSADDVRIQIHSSTAVVAFRLIGTTGDTARSQVTHYLNTGTFVKRDGNWQAVSWQATRIPRSEETARSEVAAAERALHRALMASDSAALNTLIDEGFTSVDQNGEQYTLQRLLKDLGTGQLRYAIPETSSVTVSVHGDAAVVRRLSHLVGNAKSSADSYTLTFINKSGMWKAVAMHSSQSCSSP